MTVCCKRVQMWLWWWCCRNAKKRADLGELAQYLNQVDEAMQSFEKRLWSLARSYHTLAQQQPRVLVDVARIVEMQEQVIPARLGLIVTSCYLCGR